MVSKKRSQKPTRKRATEPKRDTTPLEELAARECTSPGECARILGVARATIYHALAAGHLKSFTLGRRRLISREARQRFLVEREGAANGA